MKLQARIQELGRFKNVDQDLKPEQTLLSTTWSKRCPQGPSISWRNPGRRYHLWHQSYLDPAGTKSTQAKRHQEDSRASCSSARWWWWMTKKTPSPRSCVFKAEHGPPSASVWRHLGKNGRLNFFSPLLPRRTSQERKDQVRNLPEWKVKHSPASHGASYGIHMGLLKMFSSDEYQLHRSLQSQCKDGLLFNFVKLYSKSITIFFYQDRNIRLFLKTAPSKGAAH